MSFVAIAGTSGYVGQATVQAFAKAFPKVTVKAGVRDPSAEKAQSLKAGDNIQLTKIDMNDAENMKAEFKNADAVYIITPGHIDRTKITIGAIDAAKAAGAKYIVVVSFPTAHSDSCFGKQIGPVEDHLKASGVAYAILRLPMFIDNFWGLAAGIKGDNKIYAPVKPEAAYCPIAVEDIGLASATILANPEKHQNKIYTLTSAKNISHAEIAKVFSDALGRQIDYVQVPYEAAQKAFMDIGLPEWQAAGVMELYKYVDAGDKMVTTPTSDFKDITGNDPKGFKEWLEPVKGAF
ncbi:uncharacterized protein MONBRDRAFT_12808 [Monosiga brevicollis MX1]|uniref:NmrA-like domain-containing protein n=1 Tax=Monosiga brevicollis TaxID=81824 RepID=A9VDD8_MONBE|nr:uncharacterized protein MONBRDRAFT_12808 [Monosiga brevicollis MX1]EDQ84454.1 predicted protein [Monosiga brevicollis MX1]|eukprot:XP_001750749.1 hypothetical protein [Monosiga brevicollis MX1]